MVNAFALRVGGAVISVNKSDRPALLVDVRQRLRDGVGFAIATLNLDHLVKIRRVAAFREFDEKLLAEQHLIYDDEAAIMQNSREAQRDLDNLFEADIAGEKESQT